MLPALAVLVLTAKVYTFGAQSRCSVRCLTAPALFGHMHSVTGTSVHQAMLPFQQYCWWEHYHHTNDPHHLCTPLCLSRASTLHYLTHAWGCILHQRTDTCHCHLLPVSSMCLLWAYYGYVIGVLQHLACPGALGLVS